MAIIAIGLHTVANACGHALNRPPDAAVRSDSGQRRVRAADALAIYALPNCDAANSQLVNLSKTAFT